nr:PadR family transcriptional regulator [Rhodococcus sp. (in: high G+C Gram-positive bacteria)]
MAQGDLNTTSYVILGLLISRDWSAYEIAEQVGRGVAEVWPRADRQRYNTPKRLLERGLVTARADAVGTQRSRTVYSITPEGRAALRDWLNTASRPSSLEFEGMIRVMFAEQGSIADLRTTLTTIGEQARQSRALFVGHAERMLQPDHGTFPDREHLMALANRFMVGHFTHMAQWSEWALAETRSWSDTVEPAVTEHERSREIFEGSIDQGKPG